MIKNFCCARFESRYDSPSTSGINIRVVKLPVQYRGNAYPYAVIMTRGYSPNDVQIPIMPILYCPFCGTRLSDFIDSDSWINEEEKVFSRL